MFKTIQRAWKTPEVRKRLLFTLLLVVVFRLGCYITAPGVNSLNLNLLAAGTGGIAGLVDIISRWSFFEIFNIRNVNNTIHYSTNRSSIIRICNSFFRETSKRRWTRRQGKNKQMDQSAHIVFSISRRNWYIHVI